MPYTELISKILQGLSDARKETPIHNVLLTSPGPSIGNEFLFFIKPELSLADSGINHAAALGMILDSLDRFGLKITSVRVINAAYLKQHKLISQHYGVINQLSASAKSSLSVEAIVRFESLYHENASTSNLLGSLEFMEAYPFFSPTAVSILWQNSPTEKLAGGTYVQKLSIDGKPTYLINGFHPRQLEHFITPGRCIVAMSLSGLTDWNTARNRLIGKTNPAEAAEGSIRNTLYKNSKAFGLQEISSSWNGVHLSAGPLEALVELIRFTSDYENGVLSLPENFNFGRQLIQEFGKEKTIYFLKNPILSIEGRKISAFDLTEEKDREECIDLLKGV